MKEADPKTGLIVRFCHRLEFDPYCYKMTQTITCRESLAAVAYV